jgi:hypothetical protein
MHGAAKPCYDSCIQIQMMLPLLILDVVEKANYSAQARID